MCDNYKYADKKDLEMMRACMLCDVEWAKCPATSDCPRLADLLNHPVTGCDDPSGDPTGDGDPTLAE
jgi:hypothetical protein